MPGIEKGTRKVGEGQEGTGCLVGMDAFVSQQKHARSRSEAAAYPVLPSCLMYNDVIQKKQPILFLPVLVV